MAYGHVEGGFGGGVGGETIFHLAEIPMGARVGRHEGYGADGNVCLEEFLGADDGADCVGVQVEGELVEGTGCMLVAARDRFFFVVLFFHLIILDRLGDVTLLEM